MKPNVVAGLTIAVLALALVIGGLGAGIAISGKTGPPVTTTVTATSTTTNSTSPYVLTLVITINNLFNSTAGDMPAYYVLGPQGLQSSASISVPANRLIKLVIINYDNGNATMVQPGVNNVKGTVNNTIFVTNNDYVNSTQGPSGINIRGTQTLNTVDPEVLAHTFSVQSLGLNVPLPENSTVVGYFTIGQPGTYIWQCMTLCGGAAMASPGWMTGELVASD